MYMYMYIHIDYKGYYIQIQIHESIITMTDLFHGQKSNDDQG